MDNSPGNEIIGQEGKGLCFPLHRIWLDDSVLKLITCLSIHQVFNYTLPFSLHKNYMGQARKQMKSKNMASITLNVTVR